MSDRRIELRIDADGRLHAETKGFKGETCQKALESLLADLASLNEATPTAEAREREAGVEVRSRRDVKGGTR